MDNYEDSEIINVGSGQEVSIAELARLVADVVGYTGLIQYNSSMPDGTPRKLLDGSRLKNLGWSSSISLREGISSTYSWFIANRCPSYD